MMSKMETGPLSGRPYGGIMVLIKKSLRSITETIHCEERFAIIKIANYIFLMYIFHVRGVNTEI